MDAVPFAEDDEYPDYSREDDTDPPESEDHHLWVQDWDDPSSVPAECATHLRQVDFHNTALAADSALLAVIEVSRHGARAPGKLYPFDASYWTEEDLEELTGVGMRQHFLIGAEFRQRYVVDQQLLSPTYNEAEVEVWSTDSNRTLTSAYCQLLGLYPPGSGPTVTGFPLPPIGISNLAKLEASLGNSALPESWQPIPIYSQPTSSDYILKGYSGSVCPFIDQLEEDVMNGDYYQSQQSNLNMTLFKQLSQALGFQVKTIKQASSISSAIECDCAAGYSLPPKITPELFNGLQRVHALYRYTVPFADTDALRLSFSAFFIEVLRIFDDALAGKGPKFTLLSGHDTMLSGLLTVFQWVQETVPPFASVFLFELYANATVVVSYNDEVISNSPCEGPPCSYEEFKKNVTEFVYPDYEYRCHSSTAWERERAVGKD